MSSSLAERGQKGAARMRQIAAENERDRRALEAKLVADLGHVPSAVEAIAIETLAATLIRSRRLQAMGRPDLAERRLATRLLRELGVKTSAAPQRQSPADFFAEMQAAARPKESTA